MSEPPVRLVTDKEYPYRCSICTAPAWVIAIEGDLLCQACLKKRRRNQKPRSGQLPLFTPNP